MRGPWVVVFLMACGGGDDGAGKLADARPTMDAEIDGMTATDEPVTITVTQAGAPRAGVHVYFVAADGTPVKTVDTDADGNASALVAAGASVTALDPFARVVDPGTVSLAATENLLVTYLGVKPGDHLRLTESGDPSLSFTLTTPAVDGATDYDVVTSCGTGSLSPPSGEDSTARGELQLHGCGAGVEIAVTARAVESEGGTSTVLGGLYQADAKPIDGGTLDLAGPYKAAVNRAIEYDNLPEAFEIQAQYAPLTPRGPIAFDVPLSDGAGLITVPDIAPLYSATSLSFRVDFNQHKVIDWGVPAASYKLDLTGQLLPEFLGQPSYDFATGKVTWSQADTGAAPNTTITTIEASRSEPQLRSWTWLVISPYSRNELKLPTLPTDVASWIPAGSDGAFIDHVSNLQVSGGYDAIRARTIDFNGNDLALIAGIVGRIVSVQSDASVGTIAATRGRPARQSLLGTRRSRALGHTSSGISRRR